MGTKNGASFKCPYSDDVSAIEVKKYKLPLQISQISFGEIPQSLAEMLDLFSFPCC